jgi:hypothetical protein
MEGCKQLRIVNVGNTELAGTLASLADMRRLTHVLCDYTQATTPSSET